MERVPPVLPSFYRRPLPEGCIAFSSAEGRDLSRGARARDHGGFFVLAEQFHTQSEPALCGLGTLVVILNALAIDPGRRQPGFNVQRACKASGQLQVRFIGRP